MILAGWINIDRQPYPGVDKVHDITLGLPWKGLRFVFAEHFLEHLPYDQAMQFLRNCRAALSDHGILRLSTPNLDWVWLTHYHLSDWKEEGEAVRDCYRMNKAFHGWGHQFLYNYPTLVEVLHDAGFAHVERQEYGRSRHPELQKVEHHEPYHDVPHLPHVLIVEASGRRSEPSLLIRDGEEDFRSACAAR